MVSVLTDEDMKYRRSFYYWAAFISHGFASVKLDDVLLDQIHERLEVMRRESIKDEPNDPEPTLEMAMLTLTRDAYHRLEHREQTLSREWCEKWGVQ